MKILKLARKYDGTMYILISNSFLRKLRTKDYVICDSSLEGEIGGDAFPW